MSALPLDKRARGAGDNAQRRAILVLGMHRSGTSAVTRCLNLLGVDLGSDLLPAAEGNNRKGFWEHTEAVRIHEDLLTALNRAWGDARALPDGWLSSSAAGKARDDLGTLIRNEFNSSPLWALKDPRLCRLVPLWREALVEQGIDASALLVVRHPFEVARSLHVRDGTPLEIAHLAWLEHFSEAELDTRSMPRSLVRYEDLLSDWQGALSRVGRDLNLEWPRSFDEAGSDINAYLDSGERHHHASENAGSAPELLERLYSQCKPDSTGLNDWSGISRLVDDYRLMAPTFLGRDERLLEELRESKQRIGHAINAALDGFDRLASKAKTFQQSIPVAEDHAVLYFRSASEGFAEGRTQSRRHAWDDSTVTFHFELPAREQLAGLRFDPSQRPGAFRVDELRIGGVPVPNLPAHAQRVNQFSLEHQGGSGIWLTSFDDDPHVEFDLEGLAAQNSAPVEIEIDCQRLDVERMFAPFMLSKLGGLRREIESNTQTLRSQSVAVEEARQRETVLRDEVQSLRSANQQLQLKLTGSAERVTQLEKQVETQKADGQRLEAALDAADVRERTSQQEASRLMKAMVELRNDLEMERTLNVDLQANNAMWRAAQAESRAAVGAAVGKLTAIESSTLWRVFLRLRSMLLVLPPPFRRLLRRSLKGVWWSVTPWRIPERLHFLRKRAAGDQAEQVGGARKRFTAGAGPLPQPGYIYAAPEVDPESTKRTLLALSRRTVFSVIVPVYNTDPELLKRTIASVEAQWYPNWELILVDDHSSASQVRQVLDSLTDQRMTVIRLEENKGISGATNEGITRARGDFIVFLDHDDELTVDCLYELALCIDRRNPDYVYSDEDKLDVDGGFRDPFFKPDWSPDTMMSTMYTCHVSCVRRSLALEVGGLRSEYDGSQDWDFVLRVSERTHRISHIPKVLYHWRIIPESCASDLQAKPYAIDAGKRAREDALCRRGLSGELVPVPELPGHFRTRYRLHGQPLFSIIIPSKNNGAVLKTCIDSIFAKTAYRRFEVVVINNGSTDVETVAYLDELREREQVLVLDHDVPFNYSEINNFGVGHAKGGILVFLNDDTEVLSEHWLDCMGGYAQLSHIGAVGAKLLYPDRLTVQHNGVVNLRCGPGHAFVNMEGSDPGSFHRNLLEYNWLAVTGACLMLERSKFEALGGFDESLAVAYNDIDLCFRLHKKGFFQLVCPDVTLLHYESFSRGNDTHDEKKMARLGRERDQLFRKHPDLLGVDPFHNPNLDPDDPYFRIRVAPHTFTDFVASENNLQLRPGGLHGSLDTVNGKPAAELVEVPRESAVTLTGWADNGNGYAAGGFAIILKGDLRSYYAPAITGVPRPDVVVATGFEGLAKSGYRLTASLADVEPGTYRLYMALPDDAESVCKLTTELTVQ